MINKDLEDYCKIVDPTADFYLKHKDESWTESDTLKRKDRK